MVKIFLAATAIAAGTVAASVAAYATGGPPADPWASPYAILEPQTLHPGFASSDASIEGRGAYAGEDGAVQPGGDRRRQHVPGTEW
jgi:hypothetical protein